MDWRARLKIIRGIARGLAYLHNQLLSSDLPHGNLKSSNILLAYDLTPLVADFGYSPLVIPTHAATAMFAYNSPESLQYQHISPKSDVYCFGIVLLEVLSGKYPSQYNNGGKGGTDLVQWAATVVEEGREAELFDPEMGATAEPAVGTMRRLLHLGCSCVEPNPEQRPEMREVARRIEEVAEASMNVGQSPEMVSIGREGTGEAGFERRTHSGHVRGLSGRQSRDSFHARSRGGSGDAYGFDIS